MNCGTESVGILAMYPNIIVNIVVVRSGFITIHNGPSIVCLYIVVKFFFVKRNIKSLYSNISFKLSLKKLSSDLIIFVQPCLFSIISSTIVFTYFRYSSVFRVKFSRVYCLLPSVTPSVFVFVFYFRIF